MRHLPSQITRGVAVRVAVRVAARVVARVAARVAAPTHLLAKVDVDEEQVASVHVNVRGHVNVHALDANR